MADKRAVRIAEFIEPLRLVPGTSVKLATDFDPAGTGDLVGKKDGARILRQGVRLLSEYQARLAAQNTYGVLIVLQALDAGGKDSTIRHVMSGVNPQGVAVHGFKQPSAEELGHDYLWRYAQRLPARGQIGIFNRSHYEEVLVVRVHPQVLDRQRLPAGAGRPDLWTRRYGEINDWERYLSENGFKVVKLFLNLSRGSSGPGSCAASTGRTRTGSSRRTMSGNAGTGMPTRRRSRRCCRPRAPRRRPGT